MKVTMLAIVAACAVSMFSSASAQNHPAQKPAAKPAAVATTNTGAAEKGMKKKVRRHHHVHKAKVAN